MKKITMMPILDANATTQPITMTGAQRAGIILAFACFLMLVSSADAQLTLLYNFGTHAGDPAHPNYPGFVVQGRDGNLYSTSNDGGTDNAGTVFKITPAGQVSVLYSFDGVTGALPSSGLTLGTDGNFYGTTFENGPSNYGTVFKITAEGKLTLLHGFDDSDGAGPRGGHRSKARMALSTEPQKTGDRQTAALCTALLLGKRSRLFITSTEPTAASPLRHSF
jgi:uncharacterized repeat protein (TIGR03803 family)